MTANRLSMRSYLDEEEYMKPQYCCGNSIEINKGIKYLGIWSVVQTTIVILEGIALIVDDHWWGFHLILFNSVYIMQTYWYYRWFQEDRYETRKNLLKGYRWVLYQGIILYTALFAIVFYMPPEAMPDSYEDNFGNKYEFPPEKKADMRAFALYFIAVFGLFNIGIQLYFFIVVRRWADKETLIKDAKVKRNSSRQQATTRNSVGRNPTLR